MWGGGGTRLSDSTGLEAGEQGGLRGQRRLPSFRRFGGASA